MAKIYYEKDGDMKYLEGKTVAVIGYGSQGRGQSLNLKDSGVKVIIGVRKDGASWKKAKEDGLEVKEIDEAAREADIIQILIPDHIQADVYKAHIEKHLTEGKMLMFSHGFNIHFSQIIPPKNVDVTMIAPKGPGNLVRRMYVEGKSVPALIAVEQDYTGKAKQTALAYAKAIGALKAGVIETTFKEETETDLFGEQAVLCGGLTELIRAGFETLVDAGYQPEIAYFECLNEMKLIVDLIYEGGITFMRESISDTAEYGDLKMGKRIITEETRKEMKKLLKEIQTGEFAKDWLTENKVGRPFFYTMRKKESEHLIEKVGAELRKMMPWLEKKD